MRELLFSAQMQKCDQTTMEYYGVISPVLMERAALKVTEYIESVVSKNEGRILIVCGTGNNGGDGIAAARLLTLDGYRTVVYFPGKRETASVECERQLSIAEKYNIPIYRTIPEGDWNVIVDSVFGIGLNRDIGGIYADVIEQMNQMQGLKIAVDIPSGVHADTGQVMGIAFCADATVTMGFYKVGQFIYPGAGCCGKVIRAEIGIDRRSLRDVTPNVFLLDKEDLFLLPARRNDSNKGTYGKSVIVAGSKNMAGAAVLSARAAYAAGCGLVKVVTPECNREIIQTAVPEAILQTYERNDDLVKTAEELVERARSVAIGPGLGQDETSAGLLKAVLDCILPEKRTETPVIIDADGLNLLALEPELLGRIRGCILTPHIGEMSRLTGLSVVEIKQDPVKTAVDFAKKFGCILVMKDARTVTAFPDGRAYVNTSGNNGMAVGGAGDVLTGLLCGLLAQDSRTELVPVGVMLHGLAGDSAAERVGCRSMRASDLVDGISEQLMKVK